MLRNLIIKHNISKLVGTPQRWNTTMAEVQAKCDEKPGRKMKGWQIHSYGDLSELLYSDKLRIPVISKPTEVLIKVKSSAVNPIDVAMVEGYGAKMLNSLRCTSMEFPLTLGRDFCGTVVQKGLIVPPSLSVNDTVWGVVPVHQQGCHAEYAVVDFFYLHNKPSNISDVEAGSVLYAGLTAWSGLYVSGLLGGICGATTSSGGGKGKRVLILGASGGVGSMAAQIVKAEQGCVIATCSTDAIPAVAKLNVDHIIDYQHENATKELNENGPYDIILDCAGKGPAYVEELHCKFKQYVTFSSPLLKNVDSHGIFGGMLLNLSDLIQKNIQMLTSQRGVVKWGYFIPASHGIKYLSNLVERNSLAPVIQETFDFKNLDAAYKKVADKHLRGKIAVKMFG